MKTVGIIGASGYTGYELIKILSKHKHVNLSVLNSEHYAGKSVSELYPEFSAANKQFIYTNYSISEINAIKPDLMFLALPHGISASIVMQLDESIRIVDLGADFRFSNISTYEKVYNVKLPFKENIAVYGLPELFKEKIRGARIVANPGCYATACTLAALPIQDITKHIIFDCKSGWSGAGKESNYAKNPEILKDNMMGYKLVDHRHKYEIEQFVKTNISFTPHVINTFRGMLCTLHVNLDKRISKEEIIARYKNFYKDQKFVKITQTIPDIKDTRDTNYCSVGGFEIDEHNQLVIISSIDNLLKGASGQAVQNMNLMLGFKEDEGLL